MSILVVIFVPNLFFVMLGWDGLGLVSFFLIVYYQNNSSIVSGIFTVLMNRLGDSFFLASLVILLYSSATLTPFSSSPVPLLLLFLLLIAFMTKSAIFPFSSWLPIAIAAPTPISALVHSSTLVTAGLYLLIRFSYYFYSSPELISLFTYLCIFTSLYAGLNRVFEMDMKKLIALSTLSHLGFIAMAFSVGLVYLSFFHLLAHALFKSLLFITMGDVMTNLNHSQDIRYLSKGATLTPFSSSLISISIVNLLGLPILSGFFSKDLILESLNYSSSSLLVMVIMYVNVLLTYFYSFKLFYYSFQSIKSSPLSLFHQATAFHSLLISLLGLIRMVFGYYFVSLFCLRDLSLLFPSSIKLLPLLLNLSLLLYLLLNLSLPSSNSVPLSSYFSSIMFLSPLSISLSPQYYLTHLFSAFTSVEPRFLNTLFHTYPYFSSLHNLFLQSIVKYNVLIPLLLLSPLLMIPLL